MSVPSDSYAICLTGSRVINKRMAMFMEGLQSSGLGIRVWALPRGPWVLDKSERPTIPNRMGRVSLDIGVAPGAKRSLVICFHWVVLPLAVIIGFIRGVPVLYDEHDHYEMNTLEGNGGALRRWLYSRLVRSVHRLCLPCVSLVTCIHMNRKTLKRHLERWQPSILEIHNYPASEWREFGRTRNPGRKLCFVYIGGVYREKGVGAAAEAYQLLSPSERANCELHVFGEGDAGLLQELRSIAGVRVHRGVTPAQFKDFTASHLCCGLALLAGTPRYNLVGTNCTKLFEYLALGIPVIGTRVGEFPAWIEGKDVGLLIDNDLNAHQLTTQMQTMLSDEPLFRRFSDNAMALMSSDEMTWEYEWHRICQSGVVGNKAA